MEKSDILVNIVCQSNDTQNALHVSMTKQQRHHHQNEEQRHNHVRGLSEQQQSDTDEAFIYTITPSKKAPDITIKIAEVLVQAIYGTRSSVNILNNKHFKKIEQQNPCIKLKPTKTKVFACGAQHPLHLLSQFIAEIEHNFKNIF